MKKTNFEFNHAPVSLWQNPLHFIAFGFGSGAMPVAPGTFGTLAAIPFYLLLQKLPVIVYLILLIIFIILASWLCDYVSKEIKIHDHPGMNIDEFIGFWVTMIAIPKGWWWIFLGFVLFRFFDILKPQPIGWIDHHMKSGFGMILDDVVAGLFAWIGLQILMFIRTF